MTNLVSKIKGHFLTFDDAFRARTLRERIILGGAIVAVLLFSVDATLIRPVSARLERANFLTAKTTEEIRQLESQLNAARRVELSEEELAFQARKQLIERQLAKIDADIRSEISELVPPKAVVSLLEEMLAPDSDLKLVSLTSQEPHRVGSAMLHESKTEILDSTKSLFRHGLRIEIEGDFASTLDYLERVESSRWHLLWDRFEYRVTEFPSASITIDLHTVSEQEEWLGV